MRGTRWLLLLAILAVLGGVGVTYRLQQRILQQQAPAKPPKLPVDLKSSAEDWVWSQTELQTDCGRPKVTVRARNFRQVKNSGTLELEGVKLQILNKECDAYNLVKSEHAQFSQTEQKLYSDGEVEITLGVPLEGAPKHKPVSIRTSGVTYMVSSGTASTERAASFVFEHGTGKAVGAIYDPGHKQLSLSSQVEVDWKMPGPHAKPMKIESGQLTYQEGASKIFLAPWARLTRENTVVESASAVLTLENGAIRAVEASKAHGVDHYPQRQLEYSADGLWVNLSEKGEVEKVAGQPNARLVSTSEGARTVMTADRVDLEFAQANGENVLTRALANGNGVVESTPLPLPGRLLPETRVLRSAVVEVKMRPDGREIDSVVTHAPGTMEFLPNRAGQRHRTLTAERMTVTYGPRNQIQTFRAVNVTTTTDPTPEQKARKQGVATTASKNLLAHFDPKTGQMSSMEQWDDFTYRDGDRQARAARALLESQQNLITLDTGAKLWDATGSTFADHIRLDQRSGNFEAQGHVTSSRQPDQKKPSSELLSGDQPLQAVAQNMTSANRNQLIHYAGKVTLWQGANRIQADQVDIDRQKRRLAAGGNVVTQFLDENKDEDTKKPAAPPLFTVVKSARLVYTEGDRLAHYAGGVTLDRPGLNVRAAELRCFLAPSGSDDRLDHAFADGKVTIVQNGLDRTRTFSGEHAEYYTEEQKIVMRGGEPQLVDSKSGNTKGVELTYFADDDRLLVNGLPGQPATSRIRRK